MELRNAIPANKLIACRGKQGSFPHLFVSPLPDIQPPDAIPALDTLPHKTYERETKNGNPPTQSILEDAKVFKETFGNPDSTEEKNDIIQAQIIKLLRREATAEMKENDQDF